MNKTQKKSKYNVNTSFPLKINGIMGLTLNIVVKFLLFFCNEKYLQIDHCSYDVSFTAQVLNDKRSVTIYANKNYKHRTEIQLHSMYRILHS